ncbi:MAG: hypothetical protein KGI49_00330 [Patescibacteria group bacterium]|nr:hypothetical protein [Patescibacteria group bacterium]
MTPEERALLERTAASVEENNKILRGLRRSNRTAIIMRVVYWIVIIVLSFGAYYLIQPYFDFLTSLGSGGGSSQSQNGSLPDMQQVQNAAQSLKQLLQQQ